MQVLKKRNNKKKKTKGEKTQMMKRYMHGELAPDAPKAPNDPMAIDPNSKVNKEICLVMVMMQKGKSNQK